MVVDGLARKNLPSYCLWRGKKDPMDRHGWRIVGSGTRASRGGSWGFNSSLYTRSKRHSQELSLLQGDNLR